MNLIYWVSESRWKFCGTLMFSIKPAVALKYTCVLESKQLTRLVDTSLKSKTNFCKKVKHVKCLPPPARVDRGTSGCGRLSLHRGGLQLFQEVLQQERGRRRTRHEVWRHDDGNAEQPWHLLWHEKCDKIETVSFNGSMSKVFFPCCSRANVWSEKLLIFREQIKMAFQLGLVSTLTLQNFFPRMIWLINFHNFFIRRIFFGRGMKRKCFFFFQSFIAT